MMIDLRLTLALEHYDRHLPLLDGTVRPSGIDLHVLKVGQVQRQEGRHERMLAHREFDACELSLSSYIMAKARGAQLTAIPIFPRRLFSQSQMYINTSAGIRAPSDLVGKRVALRSFQTTLSVLAKGDLAHDYAVPLNAVTWVTTADEPVAFDVPAGVTIERMDRNRDLGEALVAGDVDAYMAPRPPDPYLAGAPQVARLFEEPMEEEIAYFKRNGFYPIMHVIALKAEILERDPWVAVNVFNAFQEAKAVCASYYDDPNWSLLAWGRQWLERELRLFGADPWPEGYTANKANLARFVQYEVEQGLIPRTLPVSDLFFETTHGT